MSIYLLGVEGVTSSEGDILIGAAVVLIGDLVYNGVSGLTCKLEDIPDNSVTMFDNPIEIDGDRRPYYAIRCPASEWLRFTLDEDQTIKKENVAIGWFFSEREWEEWRQYNSRELTATLKDMISEAKPNLDLIKSQVSKVLLIDNRNAVALGVKARGMSERAVNFYRMLCRERDRDVFNAVYQNNDFITCDRCGYNKTPRVGIPKDHVNEGYICKACFNDAYENIVALEEPFVWKHEKTATLYVPFAARGKTEADLVEQVCYYKHDPKNYFNRAEDSFWIRPRSQWHKNDDGTPRFSLYGKIRGLDVVPYIIIDS